MFCRKVALSSGFTFLFSIVKPEAILLQTCFVAFHLLYLIAFEVDWIQLEKLSKWFLSNPVFACSIDTTVFPESHKRFACNIYFHLELN